jgi:RNA polymerase sigma-70 factor, ECF subfamily
MRMMQTDNELVEAYHQGDSGAFRELFARHKGMVFNFSLRFLGNRADAEDVTSEVFLQLFHKRFVVTGAAKVTTWLLTVARNAALSRLRTRKFQVPLWFRNPETGDPEEWEIPDAKDSASDVLGGREKAAKVRQAIDKLPEEQKEALILREYHDKSYAEIAEILGCSLEKVKILIFRARESLRVELARFIKEA